MKSRLTLTPKAEKALRSLAPETKRYVREALDRIRSDPWTGKLLRDELAGLLSFRTRRFRIVYRIDRRRSAVIVVGIGPRESIYREVVSE